MQIGRVKKAQEWMGKEDGGLARLSQECENEIDFENTRVYGKEKRRRQRKVKEGIE